MPAVMPGFRRGQLQLRVVLAAGQQGLVHARQLRIEPERRHYRVRHRDRADVAGLDRPHRRLGGAHHVRSRPVVGPGRGMQTVANRRTHQLVVGGVVFHFVDAVSDLVVGLQDGAIAVGQLAPALRFAAAGDRAELVHLVQAPLPAFTDQRLDQDRRGSRVVILKWRNLVGDDVRI